MRQLKLTQRPHADSSAGDYEQTGPVEDLLSLWAALGSAGLSPEATALQPLIDGYARFVAALAKQYQHQGVSLETLVTAAHEALIALLNQSAPSQDKLNKVLPLALRNAMVDAIQAQSGGLR